MLVKQCDLMVQCSARGRRAKNPPGRRRGCLLLLSQCGETKRGRESPGRGFIKVSSDPIPEATPAETQKKFFAFSWMSSFALVPEGRCKGGSKAWRSPRFARKGGMAESGCCARALSLNGVGWAADCGLGKRMKENRVGHRI